MRVQYLGLALALALTPTTGMAQEGQGPDRPGMPRPLHQILDADGDGVLSAEEIAGASAALAALDADGDGSVSPDELRGDVSRGRAGMWRAAGPRPMLGFRGRAPFGGRPLGFFGRSGFWGWNPRASRPGGRVGRPWPGGFQTWRGRAAAPDQGWRERGPEGQGAGPMLDRLFERFDPEGAGALSAEDVPEMLWQRLAPADADGDGAVTREELQAHAQAQRERFGGARGPRRGPPQERDSEQ